MKYLTPAIAVIDDFCPDASAVRSSALAGGFGTWRPTSHEVGSGVYEGMGFMGSHGPMMRALMNHLHAVVIPNSMFFRVTHADTENAYVHSDRESGDFTCVAYLSDHSDSGTGFYRHRRTGAERMASFAEMSADRQRFEQIKGEMVRASEEDWERVQFVPAQFNRAVVFEAPLFHARHPRHGFGTTPENGRMVWVCHFVGVNLNG